MPGSRLPRWVAGAAALALDGFDAEAAAGLPAPVEALMIEGLQAYRRRWRSLIDAQATEAVA